jgi:hypothetical protein
LLLGVSQIHPPYHEVRLVAAPGRNELERFYRSLSNGERPKLVLMAPPQHGKTEQVKDFIAWIAGKRPDLKTIFASYSDELGVAVNKDLRRIMTSERYVPSLDTASATVDRAGFETAMCWST